MALIECYSKGIASAVVIALRLPRDNEPTVDNETVNIFMQMFSANSEVNNEDSKRDRESGCKYLHYVKCNTSSL